MTDYFANIIYRWYEDGKEKDLVRVAEDMGAKIIRQTPMRGLGTMKVWMKIINLKIREEHIDMLAKHLHFPDEIMRIAPYDEERHFAPLTKAELKAVHG